VPPAVAIEYLERVHHEPVGVGEAVGVLERRPLRQLVQKPRL
jgi:hypothetical protein